MPRLSIVDHGIAVDLESHAPSATPQEIETFLAAGMGGFTIEQLTDAFDAVKDKAHWKNPIDATAELTMRGVLEHAIPYFTGTPADFDEIEGQPNVIHVTAPGYFAGPCN